MHGKTLSTCVNPICTHFLIHNNTSSTVDVSAHQVDIACHCDFVSSSHRATLFAHTSNFAMGYCALQEIVTKTKFNLYTKIVYLPNNSHCWFIRSASQVTVSHSAMMKIYLLRSSIWNHFESIDKVSFHCMRDNIGVWNSSKHAKIRQRTKWKLKYLKNNLFAAINIEFYEMEKNNISHFCTKEKKKIIINGNSFK